MSEIIDMRDDLWPTSLDLLRPHRQLQVHGDIVMTMPLPAPLSVPSDDSPAMKAALDRMTELGREYRESGRMPKPPAHVAALLTSETPA